MWPTTILNAYYSPIDFTIVIFFVFSCSTYFSPTTKQVQYIRTNCSSFERKLKMYTLIILKCNIVIVTETYSLQDTRSD